ncbi:MAG: Hpt domain-containing protein [Bacteroidia bacterium]|nr:Hpt domain-containing protein [Bacteroidia bacterium]
MKKRLLYIEDDNIDVLSLKRLLNGLHLIELTICKSFQEVRNLNLREVDCILCDSNIPDVSFDELKEYVKKSRVQYVSGSSNNDPDVWEKPLDQNRVIEFVFGHAGINLSYIDKLADGDALYEAEMLETAIELLPQRITQLKSAMNDIDKLKFAAHRTMSSFRVCGLDVSWLQEIEQLTASNLVEVESLVARVESQADLAMIQLKQRLDTLRR